MPEFIVNQNFQFRGVIRREGTVLTISKQDLKSEMDLGKHPETKRPLSGLLNHCSPADEATAEMIGEKMPDGPAGEDATEAETKRMAEIRDYLDGIGKAYDRRWGLKRLENELIKAKKETGN